MAGTTDDPVPIGVLTTQDRDSWAEARKDLLAASSKNGKVLERIESAIVLVALDSTSPVTRDQVSWNLWIGDKPNRFMDKHQGKYLISPHSWLQNYVLPQSLSPRMASQDSTASTAVWMAPRPLD